LTENGDELAFASATEQAALIRQKKLSPVELVELYLRRIERIDPALNCFVLVTTGRRWGGKGGRGSPGTPGGVTPVSRRAHLDQGRPVHRGVRTTRGSCAFANEVSALGDNDVARLKGAGFIMLGKTNTPEFAIYPWTEPEMFGPTRNPWDTNLTPGGSTGGGGAALAVGLCPASESTDGGGSIRCPASCNGVFGIKPSRGRVSCAPRFGELIGGLMGSGPLTRTVGDAASILDVLSGSTLPATVTGYGYPIPGGASLVRWAASLAASGWGWSRVLPWAGYTRTV
jgi:amidase